MHSLAKLINHTSHGTKCVLHLHRHPAPSPLRICFCLCRVSVWRSHLIGAPRLAPGGHEAHCYKWVAVAGTPIAFCPHFNHQPQAPIAIASLLSHSGSIIKKQIATRNGNIQHFSVYRLNELQPFGRILCIQILFCFSFAFYFCFNFFF